MYAEIAALLLFSIIILLLVSFYYRNEPDRLPGPRGLPIVGYLPFLSPTEPHITLANLASVYGPIYGLQLGSVYAVILTDPNLVREALKRDEFTGRAPLYVTHGIMGGFGLICAEGLLWRDQRRSSISWLREMGMIKFGNKRVDLEARIMTGVNETVEKITTMSAKYFSINATSIVHHTLGNVMNDLVFGVKYEEDDETWKYLQHLQEEGVKHIGVSGVVNFLPFLRYLPRNRKTIEFLMSGKKRTHKIYDKIIDKCTKALKNQNPDATPTSILEHFLKEKMKRQTNEEKNFEFCSDEQLKHLLADLFGAGVDTTLTTLRWFFLYIAKNKEVQNKIRNEMKVHLSSAPTLNDYDILLYLKSAISETQRIRSVVPIGIPHGALIDTELCGYKIPKHAMIVPLQWGLHMDPKKWQNPEKFEPNRFLNDDGQYSVPANFMPFQTGKRMCLGDELAKMLLFLYAANILYNFEIENIATDCDLSMNGNCGITLTPDDYSLMFKRNQLHT